MIYALPKSVVIGGRDFPIRYDYRVILNIFEAMNDPELTDQERALAVLQMFYVDFDAIEDYEAAIRECFWFINGGKYEESSKKSPAWWPGSRISHMLLPPSIGCLAMRSVP